jgi:hypothetical protein
MTCDHKHGICFLPFVTEMTLEEFLRRLIHVGLLSDPSAES